MYLYFFLKLTINCHFEDTFVVCARFRNKLKFLYQNKDLNHVDTKNSKSKRYINLAKALCLILQQVCYKTKEGDGVWGVESAQCIN